MSNSREQRHERRLAELKRAFEQERDEILASIPEDYKKMFGQIGFTKWSKNLIPVVILNPYRLPGGQEGTVRHRWLAMYEKLRAQDRLDSLSYVVFFYGADDPAQYYGFVHKKKFTSYEREKSKGSKSVHELPEKIQKKIDSGATLTKNEKNKQRSYEEMEEDLLIPPEDRIRGVVEFLEEYEIRAEEELDQESNSSIDEADNFHLDEKPPDEEDDGGDEELTATAPTKTKKSRKKKTDKATTSSKATKRSKATKPKKLKQAKHVDQDREGGDESEDPFGAEAQQPDAKPEPKKKKKKKKWTQFSPEAQHDESFDLDIGEAVMPPPPPPDEQPKKKKRGRPKKSADEKAASKKKKSKKLEVIQELIPPPPAAAAAAEEEDDAKTEEVTEPAGEQKVKAEDVKLPPIAKPPTGEMNVESDGIGDEDDEDDDDKESGDDEKDPAFDELVAREEEAAAAAKDEDFEEEDLLPKKSSKKGAAMKAKEPVAKKAKKVKHKEVRPQTDERKKKVEKEALAYCEKNYLDLVERWISAVQQRSVELLREVLAEVEGVLEHFSATFIFEYGISVLMKETKSVLKEACADADLKAFGSFRAKMKSTFKTKNAVVPKKYNPKLSRPDIADKAKNPFGASSANDLDESQRSVSGRNTGMADAKPTWKDMKPISQEGVQTQPKPATIATAAPTPAAAPKSPSKFDRQQSSRSVDGVVARAPPPQPKKQKFSLGNMLRSKEPKEVAAVSQDRSAGATAHEKKVKAESATGPLPWWKNPVTNLEAPTEDPRALALEFLLQAAEHFDAGTVHGDSLARALEAAVYEWAQKNNRGIAWTNVYWDKVHALTAAMCGKHDNGSLLNLIAQGSFASPDKIAALSEDQLNESFEGRPLDI